MNFEPTFIDWMDIRQLHSGQDLPIVGGGVLVRGEQAIECDEEGERFIVVKAGDTYSHNVRPLQHCGSHDTKLLVHSDGKRVRVSGNIGRLNRTDNVFNYSLEDTVAKASEVAVSNGLPQFSTGHKVLKQSMSQHDIIAKVNPWDWTGAHFAELHATRNFMAGNEAIAKEAMRYMSAKRGVRLAKGIYGDETLVFGKQHGKLHKRVVVYRKAAEMLAHAKGLEAKQAIKKTDA